MQKRIVLPLRVLLHYCLTCSREFPLRTTITTAALPLLAGILHRFWRDKNRNIPTTHHRLEEGRNTQHGGRIWYGLADETHLKFMPPNTDGASVQTDEAAAEY